MKTYGNAKFIDCPGVTSDGIGGHAMRDGCWSCAPYWARIPLCPREDHGEGTRKLAQTNPYDRDGYFHPEKANIGYCKSCRKHFTLDDTADRHDHYASIDSALPSYSHSHGPDVRHN